MKFILGTKERMTQYFDAEGRVFPATIVNAGPVTVTKVLSGDNDGYTAVQVGFGSQKEQRTNKAQKGEWQGLETFKIVKEFRLEGASDLKRGDIISVDSFKEGDTIVVSGTSKGKGFQGVVKRHGFHGGRRSHGQKHSEREPGSIGAGGIQRVFKGTRMAGRMGGDRISVKNLNVLAIDSVNNQLLIKGAIPGRRGSLVEIRG
jgi:large subunit ribosomal protein L3